MALLILLLSLLMFLQVSAAAQNIEEANLKKPIKYSKNGVLAFSAEFSADTEVSPGGPLMFDKTITNAGGLYFNTSGQFVCPEGLYVFIWNFAKDWVSGGLTGMRCIGSLRSGGIDRKYGPKTSYFSASFSGVTEMSAIHECSNNTPTAVTINAQPWTGAINSNSIFWGEVTTFSGFRLQAGIAFTAELSEDQYATDGARIKFDKVLANVGASYDAINNRFRCPDAGVYVFTVSTCTHDPTTPWSVSRLMMEGEVVMQGPMTYIATDDYDSGSVSSTTVLQCSPDFSVYVEVQKAHDFTQNSYGATLTSFTGFKLYDITPEAVAFSVVMSQNYTSSMSDDPVPFDEVITNVGSAFDTSTSSFVCPDDAYYLFTWNGISITRDTVINLHMDGSNVKRSYTNDVSPGTSGSCTQSVVLQCKTGSVFQVVIANSQREFMGIYTSFSGYKLPG